MLWSVIKRIILLSANEPKRALKVPWTYEQLYSSAIGKPLVNFSEIIILICSIGSAFQACKIVKSNYFWFSFYLSIARTVDVQVDAKASINSVWQKSKIRVAIELMNDNVVQFFYCCYQPWTCIAFNIVMQFYTSLEHCSSTMQFAAMARNADNNIPMAAKHT